ncbi:DUF742 domain-containing protein [Streptomyces sp. LP11]|uniref:DUF742 domain-containing protein n=1 Tax=Streptomyces pyxinicus TaxID=2970331 RepID=A0ABT2AXJ2_9ACTN|nr:DUF742 domain-containing protein [Streptomyces sp. LP11]MCS0600890.1 DUF742 domain-containing protein [Streptomyces sp. LP11]
MTENRRGGPGGTGSEWYDGEAGPLVRPYAATDGRLRPVTAGARIDLLALVTLDPAGSRPGDIALGPEHRGLLRLCRTRNQSVAELATESGLPVGVVRVLLGDLLRLGCVTLSPPALPVRLTDDRVVREVIAGLRAL